MRGRILNYILYRNIRSGIAAGTQEKHLYPHQQSTTMAKSKDSDSNLFAFLGVFLTVIGFIIVLLTKKDDKYAMYYAKQGLVLFFAAVIISVAAWILHWIPFIGWFVEWVLWVLWIIAWIMGMVYSFSGDMKEIPVLGGFAKKLNV